MPKKQKLILATSTGLLLWLGWSPHSYTALILWWALIPMLFLVEQMVKNPNQKGREVFLYTFIGNLVWNVSCVYWIYHSIAAYNQPWVAMLISLIPFTLMPLLMSIPYWVLYQFRKCNLNFVAYGAFISTWLLFEYLQQTWQLAFPWMNLGNGLAQFHQIIQWYEFTGVYGGTLWLLLINIFALQCLLNPQRKKWWLSASLSSICIPILISLALYFNYKDLPNPAKVVVVQPNIDPYNKNNGLIKPEEQIHILTRLSDSIALPDTEYFIWPETAISDYVNEEKALSNPQFPLIQTFLYQYKNANVLSGLNGFKVYNSNSSKTASLNPNDGLYYDSFNTAVQIDNNPTLQFYHKSKLVPGVERMPFANYLGFLKPYLAHFGGSIGGFGYQNQPSVFYTESGIAAAPIICYESIWGNWVAQSVKKGAQFIAIITNDAWWGNTSGKDQHAQYAKIRAIENRRWIARAANTGISCFINARGDVIQESKWWTATSLRQEINLNSEQTFYTLHGDLLILFAFATAFITLTIGTWYGFRRSKKEKQE